MLPIFTQSMIDHQLSFILYTSLFLYFSLFPEKREEKRSTRKRHQTSRLSFFSTTCVTSSAATVAVVKSLLIKTFTPSSLFPEQKVRSLLLVYIAKASGASRVDLIYRPRVVSRGEKERKRETEEGGKRGRKSMIIDVSPLMVCETRGIVSQLDCLPLSDSSFWYFSSSPPLRV